MTDEKKTRRFRVVTTLVPPQSLLAGPGATNMRLESGAIVDLDADRCALHQRFIAGRLRAGDIVEDATAPAPAAEPPPAPAPPKTTLEVPSLPPKKE